ncbi:ankyrin repeat-containing domain protein [Xylogone sp. PMI_703]|nr:ankyrin repeat-containing domain protein [Xylogone sp. PMI_703]
MAAYFQKPDIALALLKAAVGVNVRGQNIPFKDCTTIYSDYARCRGYARDSDHALSYAAASGNVHMVDLLLRAGADVAAASHEAFGAAVGLAAKRPIISESEPISVMERLLAAGADVNACVITWFSGMGPGSLSFDCSKVDPSLRDFLLERGADKEFRDATDTWPLYAAAEAGNVEAVQKLLNLGVDVNLKGGGVCSSALGVALEEAENTPEFDISTLRLIYRDVSPFHTIADPLRKDGAVEPTPEERERDRRLKAADGMPCLYPVQPLDGGYS